MIRKDKPKEAAEAPRLVEPHLCEEHAADLVARNRHLAHRVDLWITATNLLAKHVSWGENESPTASDVLELALFLAEEN